MNFIFNCIFSFFITSLLFISYDNNSSERPPIDKYVLIGLALVLFLMLIGFLSAFGNYSILGPTARFLISNKMNIHKTDPSMIGNFSNIKNNITTSTMNEALTQI
jgi:hypothetical protein